MSTDKKPPEYGDNSTFDRPPPYNPYYSDGTASGPPQPQPPPGMMGFAPPTSSYLNPPPEYQPTPVSKFPPTPPPVQPQLVQIAPQQSAVSNLIQPASAATVTNVQIHISDEFGPYAQHAICPKCRQYVITKTKPVTGALTWLSCIGMFMLGCDLGCCLIPCCVDSCRDVVHKCPNCGRHIGKYKRLC